MTDDIQKTASFKIVGIAPLLMHNGRLSNPADEFTRKIKEYSSKRRKTDADFQAMADLEWRGSLYLDKNHRVVMPGQNIESMLIEAARKRRLGKDFQAGVFCDGEYPFEYTGPKDITKLSQDANFRDFRAVSVNAGKVMRCRPIFREWSVSFVLTYMPDVVNLSQLREVLSVAGKIIGLCDYTPKHGRFNVVDA